MWVKMKRLLTYLTCFLILSCQSQKDNSENGELDKSDSSSTEIQRKKNQLGKTEYNGNYYYIRKFKK